MGTPPPQSLKQGGKGQARRLLDFLGALDFLAFLDFLGFLDFLAFLDFLGF